MNIIEQYQINLAQKCQKINDNQEMSSFIKMNEFKTDGLIIYKNKKDIYKYKPKIAYDCRFTNRRSFGVATV